MTASSFWMVLAAALIAGCEHGPNPDQLSENPVFAAAESLLAEGRTSDALPRWRAVRDSLAVAGDSALLWRAQIGWADALDRLQRRDSARIALDTAFILAGNDPARLARVRLLRARLLSREGVYDDALAEAERARAEAATAGDARAEAGAWHMLGEVHSLSGRYREAIAANERQLEIRRALNDDAALASTLVQLGIDYRHVGRFSDADSVYGDALEAFRRLANPLGQARTRYNRSNLRMATGDLDGALADLTEALALVEEIGDPRGEAFVASGLADVHWHAGNHAASRRYLERALALNRRLRLPYGEATTLLTIGWIALEGGAPADADRSFAAALALADSLGLGRQRAAARSGLARLAAVRGESAEALRWADAALAIADSLDEPEARYEALEARAAALEAAGTPGAAEAYLEGVRLLESWRGRLALGDLRMGIAEPRLGVYEGAIRTLIADRRIEEAFLVAERARARLLLELMADREARHAVRGEADSLRRLLRERFEARVSTRRNDVRAALDAEISTLARALERAEGADRRGRGRAVGQLPSLAELRRELLESHRSLLAYFWGDSAVYGWRIDANGVRGLRLGRSDSLGAMVEFLRSALEGSANIDWRLPAQRAHHRFLEPLAVGAMPHLLIVPDGPLATVPFEALQAPGGAPLGIAHAVGYGPSAATLVATLRTPRSRSWERAMLAVGDPALPPDARTGDATSRSEPLRQLPYAAAEARRLRELFREEGADLLLGRDATLERWLEMKPARYRFLHFAAHARASDRRPAEAEVVLADGRLDLPRIRELSLTAELVTLSACETARGPRVRGEGVIGLPHAFLSAGASGAIVSLWPVADRAAAEFMQDFYAELRTGVPAAEALRRTRQRRATTAGPDVHPARWAAFILVGGIAKPGSAAPPVSAVR